MISILSSNSNQACTVNSTRVYEKHKQKLADQLKNGSRLKTTQAL